MERKEYRSTRARGVGQRIGPALRALRRREGLTIDDLAARCGLSRACISRIERGQQDVTLPGLMSLSTALGVDVTYFASYQDASSQTEYELREILAEVGIASQTIPSLLNLSFEAQGALLDGLRWLTLAHRSRPLRTKELVAQIVTHGVEASIAHILSAIAEFGLDVGGFCRAITQMEELSGDRMVMSERLLGVTIPTDPHVDAIDIYRSNFQREPEDATLIRWWAQALRSAVRENVSRFKTRTIYPLSAIRKYIDSGYWGVGVAVDPNLVRRHISELVTTLRENPNVHIGMVEEPVPFNLLIKGEKQAMAYVRLGSDIFPGQGPGVAFRSARTDVVHKFREYFDALWDDIPAECKDSEAVASWLETQLAAIRS